MNVKIIDKSGKATSATAKLPKQFNEPVRADLIKRAFHAHRTLFLQPKGNYLRAGFETTAEYYGRRHAWRQTINTGRSRLPREKLPGGRLGRVRIVPHSKGGHRAHPPKAVKMIIEKINLKEKNKAIRSAISATIDNALVAARGHIFKGDVPLIADASLEELKKASDAIAFLEAAGIQADLQRAREGRRMRSGRSRLRKGGYKTPKSALIVIANDKGIWKAARNIPGVDVVKVTDLNAELLAPGGVPGRLTIWTTDALKAMDEQKLYM